MTQTATKPQTKSTPSQEQVSLPIERVTIELKEAIFAQLNLLWSQRRVIQRAALIGLLLGTVVAFAIPKRYESTSQLMPPDNQSSSSVAMLAALRQRPVPGWPLWQVTSSA